MVGVIAIATIKQQKAEMASKPQQEQQLLEYGYQVISYTDSIGCNYIIFHNSQVINALHHPKCQNHN